MTESLWIRIMVWLGDRSGAPPEYYRALETEVGGESER